VDRPVVNREFALGDVETAAAAAVEAACAAVADKTSGPAAQSVPHFSQTVGMFKVDA
jgi:hypothetical protein